MKGVIFPVGVLKFDFRSALPYERKERIGAVWVLKFAIWWSPSRVALLVSGVRGVSGCPPPSGVRLSISVCPITISPLHPCRAHWWRRPGGSTGVGDPSVEWYWYVGVGVVCVLGDSFTPSVVSLYARCLCCRLSHRRELIGPCTHFAVLKRAVLLRGRGTRYLGTWGRDRPRLLPAFGGFR